MTPGLRHWITRNGADCGTNSLLFAKTFQQIVSRHCYWRKSSNLGRNARRCFTSWDNPGSLVSRLEDRIYKQEAVKHATPNATCDLYWRNGSANTSAHWRIWKNT